MVIQSLWLSSHRRFPELISLGSSLEFDSFSPLVQNSGGGNYTCDFQLAPSILTKFCVTLEMKGDPLSDPSTIL